LHRALTLDRRDQRRRQQRCQRVGHGKAEAHVLRLRIELARRQRLLQRCQRRAHLRPQRIGLRRRRHPRGVANEQRFADGIVQAFERLAGCRLSDC